MNKLLHIVADAHIWGVESAFSSLPGYNVNLRVLEHRDIRREALKDADVLLTRSSTSVNAGLLEGTPVRFVATATIGDDHLDKAWLASRGIGFANAAGSSTGSVIEYMITDLLDLHARGLIPIPYTTIGIIGAGRIGGRLVEIARSLGMKVLINDPPKQRTEGDTGFSSLDTLLEQAGVLTLHTPLNRAGEDRTVHLLNEKRLARFRGRGVINAGRGGCADNAALAEWLNGDTSRFAVLDCWENEPNIFRALLAHPQVIIATPHIAGHSLDGKAANTQYVYNALCQWLGVSPVWDMQEHLPPPASPIDISCMDDPWHDLHAAATALYPISHDDAAMRSWTDLPQAELAAAFIRYRRHYPVRRAWDQMPLHLIGTDTQTRQQAQALGMKIV